MLLDVILGDGFTPVNKLLAKDLGFLVAGYLGELVRQRQRFFEQYGEKIFYFSQEQMKNEIGISEYEQRQCLKTLKEKDMVRTTKKGLPAKYFFEINDNIILEYIENLHKQKENNTLEYLKDKSFKIGSTGPLKFEAHNNNINNNINNIGSGNFLNSSGGCADTAPVKQGKKDLMCSAPPSEPRQIDTFDQFRQANSKVEMKLNRQMLECVEFRYELGYKHKGDIEKLTKRFINLISNYIGRNEQGYLMMFPFKQEVFNRYTYHSDKGTKIKNFKSSLTTRFKNYNRFKDK